MEGCEVTSIRLIEDRETKRPKGFGYAEFADVDSLKKALELDGMSFRGRSVKVKIAEPCTSPPPFTSETPCSNLLTHNSQGP